MNDHRPASPKRFFIALASVVLVGLAVAWTWAVLGPMYFFDPEYPMYMAKLQMAERCDLGDTMVLGDSRAMAGIVPAQLGEDSTNFALAGGTPIESFYLVQRMRHCPRFPRRVVLSFLPLFLTRVHMYWEFPALYRTMTFEDMEDVRRLSVALNDPIIYSTNAIASLLDSVRNYSYRVMLPSYYFPAMIGGRFFARKASNDAAFDLTVRNRGQHFFGTAERAPAVADEGRMTELSPSPLLTHYLHALLRQLDARGVEIDFVGTPLNPATFNRLPDDVKAAFGNYLGALEARYAHFHVHGKAILKFSDDNFGDLEHVNAKGAEAWTASVKKLLSTPVSELRH